MDLRLRCGFGGLAGGGGKPRVEVVGEGAGREGGGGGVQLGGHGQIVLAFGLAEACSTSVDDGVGALLHHLCTGCNARRGNEKIAGKNSKLRRSVAGGMQGDC